MAGDTLRIRWAESGGAGVKAPLRRGFGTTLIEQSIRADSGKAEASYRSDGVTWELEMVIAPAEATDLQRRIASARTPPTESRTDRRSPIAGRRVLVIEDEPLVALELVSILEDAGAEVVGPIGLVEEAIETIASERLDAAFLDGNLHGHPVDDVASALTRAGTPFVFVSGYGRESLPAAFAHIEIVGKPFSPDQVLHASHSLLAERPAATILRTRTKSA